MDDEERRTFAMMVVASVLGTLVAMIGLGLVFVLFVMVVAL